MTILEIFPETQTVSDMYLSHGHYNPGDSGLDLFCVTDEDFLPGETNFVDLGIRCSMKSFDFCPWNWVKNRSFWKYSSYFVMPRSSLSKTPLLMKNSLGLIDSEYTGSIKVPLMNTSNEVYSIKKGDRLVQLIRPNLKPIRFKLTKNIRKTQRGSGGFGSSNK